MKVVIRSVGVFFVLIPSLLLLYSKTSSDVSAPPKEYFFITTTTPAENSDSKNLAIYIYVPEDQTLTEAVNLPVNSLYPANIINIADGDLLLSNGEAGDGFDNLYEYDLTEDDPVQKLSDGKFLFNDIIITPQNIIANTARTGATVTQPAIFDPATQEFTYLNPNDDDTWFFSLSYNYATNKLLCLTGSDAEMRTHKVVAETHIRPKTLYLMNPDFSEKEKIYYTEDFEVRLTRQLDKDHILMTVDPYMGSEADRKLKMLDLKTGSIEDFEIPDIKEIASFYPSVDGNSIVLLGRNEQNKYGVYLYDIAANQTENLFQKFSIKDSALNFVDVVGSVQ